MVWITIPTYNEAENIGDLLRQIRRYAPQAQVLVVDDNSPDGTSQIVQKMSESDAQIHLLTRFEDKGRGRSGRDGFVYALEHGAKWAIEMDADFSHHPRYLPAILDAARKNDLVIGSRYVPGGRETGRPRSREMLTSLVGHFFALHARRERARPIFGLPLLEQTRARNHKAREIVSVGPAIVSELLFKARLRNLSMTEVPIVFEDRTRGDSKLDLKTLIRTFEMVFELRKMHRNGDF
jgi:dolichol-phosphate mannosyltransferase